MAKSQNKTLPTTQSVAAFVSGIEDKERRAEVRKVCAMMRKATGARARMWGRNMIGFGEYHYRYDSGREGDYMITGLSPRKQALSIYIMPGFEPFPRLLKQLGKFKTGRSCLYVKRLSDIDEATLQELINESVEWMRERYPTK